MEAIAEKLGKKLYAQKPGTSQKVRARVVFLWNRCRPVNEEGLVSNNTGQ